MATTNPNHIFWQDIRGVYDPATGSYIFGDQTGNARGTSAIDLQSLRTAITQVSSGTTSTAIGQKCTASGTYSCAIGFTPVASAIGCTSIGSYSQATGNSATAVGAYSEAFGNAATAVGNYAAAHGSPTVAVGFFSTATANYSAALGYRAQSRIQKTVNICGAQIIRKDNAEGAAKNFESFCGVRTTLFTTELDLKTTASETITIPAGAHFFPDEVGVIVTSANTVTVQPSMRFGNSGNHAALLAITAGSGLSAAFACNRFQTLVTSAGQQDLVAEITTGATATALLGRFYFTGRLVEDE